MGWSYLIQSHEMQVPCDTMYKFLAILCTRGVYRIVDIQTNEAIDLPWYTYEATPWSRNARNIRLRSAAA